MINIELTGQKFERLRTEFIIDDIDIIILAHISSDTRQVTIMQIIESMKPIASKNNTHARIKNLIDSGYIDIAKSDDADMRKKKLHLTKKALKINNILGA